MAQVAHEVSQSYLSELKAFVTLHLRSQSRGDAADYETVLDCIDSDEQGPGGWAPEWVKRGQQFEQSGMTLQAIQCYNFARFPFIESEARKDAYSRCASQFSEWVQSQDPRVQRVSVRLDDGEAHVYTLLTDPARPLLVVMGGIVSVKEQWQALLFGAYRLGFSPVIADFPGVGENGLAFNPESGGFISSLLDYFGPAAERTYVVGMSFGGTIAMKAAVKDRRIKGITTIGAPVFHFYTDRRWWKHVPTITKRALSHSCGIPEDELTEHLQQFALTPEELQQLDIPVHYLLSLRDEITPPQEREVLEGNLRKLNLTVVDDVHGAANHMDVLRKYIPWSIVRQRNGAASPMAILLRAALTAAMWKRKRIHQ